MKGQGSSRHFRCYELELGNIRNFGVTANSLERVGRASARFSDNPASTGYDMVVGEQYPVLRNEESGASC